MKLLSINSINQTGKIIIFCIIAILIAIALVFTVKKLTDKKVSYSIKDKYLTETELTYFNIICRATQGRYYVYPQINLASVINKNTPGFRTELFRNVDFGIFDRNFHPVLLIEINDNTHLRHDREERDKSVNKICKSARLPLITIWTRDGINEEKIIRTIERYLR